MIAIHHQTGSFSEQWEKYCVENAIPFIRVNIFDHGIVQHLRQERVTGLLFHVTAHMEFRTRVAAHAVCRSLELCGIAVYPNDGSYWHCDDKISQHYLFEALGVPRCINHIFYGKKEAMEWANTATYPKVFKLRCGASSSNVQLVRSKRDAVKLINKMFGSGLKATPGLFDDLATKSYKHHAKRDWKAVCKRLPATVSRIITALRTIPKERGYVYFQDFVANNDHDTRVVIIGKRAFAYRRMVRANDFRASGSGKFDVSPEMVDPRCIDLAFQISRKIESQSLALDFLFDDSNSPIVVECCYAFGVGFVPLIEGYWDDQLQFQRMRITPPQAILEDFLTTVS
jgi:glutathione synthase/RimK-type ligase-like ATP-grasp enzyme